VTIVTKDIIARYDKYNKVDDVVLTSSSNLLNLCRYSLVDDQPKITETKKTIVPITLAMVSIVLSNFPENPINDMANPVIETTILN